MIQKKAVAVFGVFDYFHPGHRWFLKKAKTYGDHLTVILAEDCIVKEIKGEAPTHPWSARKKVVLSSGLADAVMHGDRTLGKWKSLQQLQPAAVVTGYDQVALRKNLRQWQKINKPYSFQIVRLSGTHTKVWKSSIVKRSTLPV